MPQPELAPHEAMEIHELLNFATICTAKAKAMDGLVMDKELKALMQQDLQRSIQATKQLQGLLSRAQLQ
jgi:similar to spore coat protein